MQKLEQMHSHACAFNCLDLKAGHTCYYYTVVITFQSEKKLVKKSQEYLRPSILKLICRINLFSHCYSEFEETATKSYSILDWIKDYFETQAEKKISMSVSKERKKKSFFFFHKQTWYPSKQKQSSNCPHEAKNKWINNICSLCSIFCFPAIVSCLPNGISLTSD